MNSTGVDLLVDIRDGTAVPTMNRPERLNAPSPAMIDAAIGTLERCASEPTTGCIVLTGPGAASAPVAT